LANSANAELYPGALKEAEEVGLNIKLLKRLLVI
jgi:hypothetical protein